MEIRQSPGARARFSGRRTVVVKFQIRDGLDHSRAMATGIRRAFRTDTRILREMTAKQFSDAPVMREKSRALASTLTR